MNEHLLEVLAKKLQEIEDLLHTLSKKRPSSSSSFSSFLPLMNPVSEPVLFDEPEGAFDYLADWSWSPAYRFSDMIDAIQGGARWTRIKWNRDPVRKKTSIYYVPFEKGLYISTPHYHGTYTPSHDDLFAEDWIMVDEEETR